MRMSTRERVLACFTRIGKKNKCLKFAMLPLLFVVMFLLSVVHYIFSNGKKYACIIAVFLFFMLSNSFSFPIFEEIELGDQTLTFVEDNHMTLYEKEHALAAKEETPQMLEDEDVMDGYVDAEIENIDDIDLYTLDEILVETEEEEEEAQDDTSDNPIEEFRFDRSDWRLLLINKQHPIPDDYSFELGTIKGSMKCDKRIISDLFEMLQAAKNDGVNLVICSPYRDMSRQEALFGRKISAYMGKGMSYMDAYKVSSQAVTVPGASEHQVGLALDIVCDTYTALNEGFGDTTAGKWLNDHSYEYGFTLRYPKGKEYITSIEFEPWHFRYVGKNAAKVMHEKGICLEEFIDSL